MMKGKVALVTGSTSGIGLGIAQALAAAGADVVLNGFGEAQAIEQLRQDVSKEYGVKVTYSGADMMKPPEIVGMIETATREHGHVDIVVNNAGIQHVAPVHEFPVERWDAVIAINLTAPFHVTRAVLPQMLARNWGASSTSPPPTASSPRCRSRLTSPPSTGSRASPRRWR